MLGGPSRRILSNIKEEERLTGAEEVSYYEVEEEAAWFCGQRDCVSD